ncbi:MAG: M28 family peptidase [Terriglobales bacterium]
MTTRIRLLLVLAIVVPQLSFAQSRAVPGDLVHDMQALVREPAVPGYESKVSASIADQLKSYSPKIDSMGNVTVTIGDGAPHRLIVAPIDEPGFVVSQITDDGYLHLQRLPQFGNLPQFNQLQSAQPMLVANRNGLWTNAAMSGPSVHLQPPTKPLPDMNDIEMLYVDVGATTRAEVRSAGIDLLAPVAIQRDLYQLANGNLAGPAVGDRFGAAALLQLLRGLDIGKIKGSLTLAFLTQNWTGARGLVQLLNRTTPDELIFVGRLMPTMTSPAPAAAMGDSGIVIALDKPDAPLGELGEELQATATKEGVKVAPAPAAPLLPRSYLPLPKLPARTVHLSVPMCWPVTPGEILNANDVAQLVRVLDQYLTGSAAQGQIATIPPSSAQARAKLTTQPTTTEVLKALVESYGVSDHETAVRDTVRSLLPRWAKPTDGPNGDLVLEWGDPSKAPDIVIVAHMDEIGYEVKSVLPDGRLELEDKGGGLLPFFEGHVALVHSANGQHAAVLELPEGWQKADFKFKDERNPQVFADVGAVNPEHVAKLGIKAGDFITVPKKYEPLLGHRALGRSFDDRVGCTALISAAWALGPQLNGRRVTFVWSTGEELGLVGAAAYARQLAASGKSPKYVFAVDTFVSSDSPIESKRFGDAIVGNGFVIRAIDNSNIAPHKDVERLLQLMAAKKIPVQYGVTGGGNDGSAFVPYGSIDVAIGWPLRYSHSPAEVVDIRDVDSLARAVTDVARSW